MAILNAFAALQASGLAATSNLKFLFEGEEEAGSPHLGEIIKLHQDLLQADAWIICDGPVHQSGVKQVVLAHRRQCGSHGLRPNVPCTADTGRVGSNPALFSPGYYS
jgi:acetylornithine deacetylase/succinyl-diaminopimelate desuccinylase-like protein